MDPTTYQRLAERTECDQSAARARHYSAGEYQTQMQRFLHAAAGIASEAGELLALYVRFVQYGQCDTKLPLQALKERVADELGDVVWHVAQAANAFGLDLDEVMRANLRELAARYPDKYTDQCAADRDRAAEAEAARGSGDKAWDRIIGGLRESVLFAQKTNSPADGRPDPKASPPRPEDPE